MPNSTFSCLCRLRNFFVSLQIYAWVYHVKTVEHVLKMQMITRVLVFLASLEETAKQVMKRTFENSQFSAIRISEFAFRKCKTQ